MITFLSVFHQFSAKMCVGDVLCVGPLFLAKISSKKSQLWPQVDEELRTYGSATELTGSTATAILIKVSIKSCIIGVRKKQHVAFKSRTENKQWTCFNRFCHASENCMQVGVGGSNT
jgi:hypothetical protein